jgi:hypothetical protein
MEAGPVMEKSACASLPAISNIESEEVGIDIDNEAGQ